MPQDGDRQQEYLDCRLRHMGGRPTDPWALGLTPGPGPSLGAGCLGSLGSVSMGLRQKIQDLAIVKA